MQDLAIDSNLVNFLLVVVAVLLILQAYMLLRIRNMLQAIALNFDSITYLMRKLSAASALGGKTASGQFPRTCQFCKHRLAFINTGKTSAEEDDFYHRCSLRNINVSLEDSCPKFETDERGGI